MPNLGALTTTFTPAASCTNLFFNANQTMGWMAQMCVVPDDTFPFPMVDNLGCHPTRSIPATTKQNYPLGGYGFYSPGLACPAGYQTACAQTGPSTGSGGWGFQFVPSASETAYGCCPTGYTCAIESKTQTCMSVATEAPTTYQCINNGDGSTVIGRVGLATLPSISTSTQTLTRTTVGSDSVTSVVLAADVTRRTVTALTLRAPLVQLVRQASDNETTTSSEPSSVATPATTVPTVSLAAPTASSEASASSSQLSAGAKAGIAVGTILGAILMATVAFCVWRRKRAVAHSEMDAEHADHPPVAGVAADTRSIAATDNSTDPRSPSTAAMTPASPRTADLYADTHDMALAREAGFKEQELDEPMPMYELSAEPEARHELDAPPYGQARTYRAFS